jgi:Trypsin-like peptidase domain
MNQTQCKQCCSSLSKSRFARAFGAVIVLAFLVFGRPVALDAQSDEALALKPNVVRISSSQNGNEELGFGFIVGEDANGLYIVTAKHVIGVSSTPGDPSPSVNVFLFSDQSVAHVAEILNNDRDHDLSLIRIKQPYNLNWTKKCLASSDEASRSTPVLFIGRNTSWYVPAVNGQISSDGPDANGMLSADMYQLQPGSSGGPLVTNTGIVGMVEAKSADDGKVLSIEAIKSAVEGWGYPWQLKLMPLPLQGDWSGTLQVPLPLVFTLRPNGVGTTDAPKTNNFGIPITYTAMDGSIRILVPSQNAGYVGTFTSGSMNGTFVQNGSLPLTLTRDGGPSQDGSVIGTWRGSLHAPLPLKLHLDSNGGGTADDLAHAALGMTLEYTLQNRDFSFQIPSVGASFTGHAQLQKIDGTFSQNGNVLPLVFTKN